MNKKSNILLKKELQVPVKNKEKFRQEILQAIKQYLDTKKAHQILYVIDELVSNIEEHGYDGKEGEVNIKIIKFKNHIRIEIRDYGKKIPTKKDYTLDIEKIIKRGGRGLGLFSIQKMVDFLQIKSLGKKNLTIIKKKIQ